jgi:hypothetical protein
MPYDVVTMAVVLPPPKLILDPYNDGYCANTVPASLKINNVAYLRKAEVAHVHEERERRAACWKYGEALIRINDKKEVYYCWLCERVNKPQKLPVLNGSRAGNYHLLHIHQIDCLKNDTSDAATTFKELVVKKDFNVFRRLLIHWFVFCQLAFFMLENMLFRDLVKYLNASLGVLLPKARATLRKWIMDEYSEYKDNLKKELTRSLTKIHLSFDIWTAGSWIGVISIWAYWIDRRGERQRRLLAFRRIYRSHDGDNQAEIVLEVLEEYEIAAKVGYFVCDNATSNDNAVAIILKQLDERITAPEITSRRLRCLGHIINLAARSLLQPTYAEAITTAEELDIDESTLISSATLWESKGPLGKLHRVIKYVLASPQRREEFGEISGGRTVKEFDHLGVSCYISKYCSFC